VDLHPGGVISTPESEHHLAARTGKVHLGQLTRGHGSDAGGDSVGKEGAPLLHPATAIASAMIRKARVRLGTDIGCEVA
jgi:hypothetical protein